MVKSNYENTPMQYTGFSAVKNHNFSLEKKRLDISIMFPQNIDCGHTLEPSRQGGFNECPQSMFRIRNKKN